MNFEKYISNICKKASNQLNAICRLPVQTFMGKKKKAMINTSVHSNYNYRPDPVSLYLAVLNKSSKIKLKKKFMKRSLKSF